METNQVLRFVLELQKEQALYAHRQHGWIVALAETVRKNPQLAADLEQHPFYDQGPQPSLRKIDVLISNIDAIIHQLK